MPSDRMPGLDKGKIGKSQDFFKKGAYDPVPANVRPTIFDFHWLDMGEIKEGTKEEEEFLLSWIEKELGVNPDLVMEDGETKESSGFYARLNDAYNKGRHFLRFFLKYPHGVTFGVEITRLSSKKDIFDLLRKTKFGKKGNGLEQTAKYCVLIKTTVAMYELLEHGLAGIEELSSELERAMFSGGGPFVLDDEKKLDQYKKGFKLREREDIQGFFELRIKAEDSAMLRGTVRAESNADAALKDAIAFRFEVADEEIAAEIIRELGSWIVGYLPEGNIKMEDKNFFSPKILRGLSKKFSIERTKSNPQTSGGAFSGFIITGRLYQHLPNSQFEIQFVLKNNKNEEGGMHHDIYDVAKKVFACTRLGLRCSSAQFEAFVIEAHDKSGLDIQYIKKHLLGGIAPRIERKGKGKELYYVARENIERWGRLGWIEEK